MIKLAEQQKLIHLQKIEERQRLFSEKLKEIQINAEKNSRNLKSKALEYEKQAIFFKKEKEYLESKSEELTQENEKTKFQINSMREDYEQEVQELETRVRTYKQTFVSPREFEIKFQAQTSALEAQLIQKNEQILNLETAVQNLTLERKQLADLAQKRMHNLQNLQQSIGLTVSRQEIENIKKQMRSLRKDNDQLQEKLLKVKAEKNSLLTNASNLKSESRGLRSQNYDLTEILERKKKLVERLEAEVQGGKEQFSKLFTQHHKSKGDGMAGQGMINSLSLQVQRLDQTSIHIITYR